MSSATFTPAQQVQVDAYVAEVCARRPRLTDETVNRLATMLTPVPQAVNAA